MEVKRVASESPPFFSSINLLKMITREDTRRWLVNHKTPGWYHNGRVNFYPTIEAEVTQISGGFRVCISAYMQLFEFSFTEAELHQG